MRSCVPLFNACKWGLPLLLLLLASEWESELIRPWERSNLAGSVSRYRRIDSHRLARLSDPLKPALTWPVVRPVVRPFGAIAF